MGARDGELEPRSSTHFPCSMGSIQYSLFFLFFFFLFFYVYETRNIKLLLTNPTRAGCPWRMGQLHVAFCLLYFHSPAKTKPTSSLGWLVACDRISLSLLEMAHGTNRNNRTLTLMIFSCPQSWKRKKEKRAKVFFIISWTSWTITQTTLSLHDSHYKQIHG
jgi:hypothetical protein